MRLLEASVLIFIQSFGGRFQLDFNQLFFMGFILIPAPYSW